MLRQNPITKRFICDSASTELLFGSKEYVELLSVLLIPEELREPSEYTLPTLEGSYKNGFTAAITFSFDGANELICTFEVRNRRMTPIRIQKRTINSLDDLYIPFTFCIGNYDYFFTVYEDKEHTSLALAEIAKTIKAPVEERDMYISSLTIGSIGISLELPENVEDTNIPTFYKVLYKQLSSTCKEKLLTTFFLEVGKVKFMSVAEICEKLINYYKSAQALVKNFDEDRELRLLKFNQLAQEEMENERFISEQITISSLAN